jgi:hypothetical protein
MDARDGGSLADLRRTRQVVPRHWFIGVTPPKIEGRALSSESWA